MKTVKLTSRGRITVPKKIREDFHLKAGDHAALSVEGNHIAMQKIPHGGDAFPGGVEGTLGEWNSPADEKGWRYL